MVSVVAIEAGLFDPAAAFVTVLVIGSYGRTSWFSSEHSSWLEL